MVLCTILSIYTLLIEINQVYSLQLLLSQLFLKWMTVKVFGAPPVRDGDALPPRDRSLSNANRPPPPPPTRARPVPPAPLAVNQPIVEESSGPDSSAPNSPVLSKKEKKEREKREKEEKKLRAKMEKQERKQGKGKNLDNLFSEIGCCY